MLRRAIERDLDVLGTTRWIVKESGHAVSRITTLHRSCGITGPEACNDELPFSTLARPRDQSIAVELRCVVVAEDNAKAVRDIRPGIKLMTTADVRAFIFDCFTFGVAAESAKCCEQPKACAEAKRAIAPKQKIQGTAGHAVDSDTSAGQHGGLSTKCGSHSAETPQVRV